MVVLTFSGVAIADAQPLASAAGIVRRAGAPAAVVVPALAGIPERTDQVVRLARSGHYEAAHALVGRIRQRHVDLLLKSAPCAVSVLLPWIHAICDNVDALLRASRSAGIVTPELANQIGAAGPLLSSRLVASAFDQSGVPSVWVHESEDARAHILDRQRTQTSLSGDPVVPTWISERVRTEADRRRIPVLAAAPATATLADGDAAELTAAHLAASLDAREVQCWGHQHGVLAADPSVVPAAHVVPQLSFAEAAALARSSRQCVGERAIDVAGRTGIPIRVLNARRPEEPGTTINGKPMVAAGGPAALAMRRGIAVLHLTSRCGPDALALPRRILDLCAGLSRQPLVASKSNGAVLAAFQFADDAVRTAAAAREFAHVNDVPEMAFLSAIGEGLTADPLMADHIVATLDDVTVHAWANAPSRVAVTLLLDEADAAVAMRRIYDRFVARGSCSSRRADGSEVRSA